MLRCVGAALCWCCVVLVLRCVGAALQVQMQVCGVQVCGVLVRRCAGAQVWCRSRCGGRWRCVDRWECVEDVWIGVFCVD